MSNARTKKPSILATIGTEYSKSLSTGFEDHGILFGSIALVWNTLKFGAMLIAFGLTGGLALHGWLRTNSSIYNTVDNTGVLEVGQQDTLEELTKSAVEDYTNTIDKFSSRRKKTKADSEAVNTASDDILNTNVAGV